MQVLAMINTGKSTNKTCMSSLRELFWICFVNYIDLFATYIKSEDNVLADALSCTVYPWVTQKCFDLLQDFKMCCSPTSKLDVLEPQVSSTDASVVFKRSYVQNEDLEAGVLGDIIYFVLQH